MQTCELGDLGRSRLEKRALIDAGATAVPPSASGTRLQRIFDPIEVVRGMPA